MCVCGFGEEDGVIEWAASLGGLCIAAEDPEVMAAEGDGVG